jgi:guanosine-3',5'-bis(diphosphate) 3'-pyrophosphohydrolase
MNKGIIDFNPKKWGIMMSLELCENDFGVFLRALHYAARCHANQRRKGSSHAPYINHPISLVMELWQTGGVRDRDTLVAALLHDTIEDTGARPEDIREQFGEAVLSLVLEVTDDKSLPKAERKRLQVVNAPHKSPRARQIKLADKINNVFEIAHDPPADWSLDRRREYLDWTKQVIDGLRGHSLALEARYDAVLAEARTLLAADEKKQDQN